MEKNNDDMKRNAAAAPGNNDALTTKYPLDEREGPYGYSGVGLPPGTMATGFQPGTGPGCGWPIYVTRGSFEDEARKRILQPRFTV